MDVKKFVLSYYKTATKDFHIMYITNPQEALRLHSHNYFQVYYVLQGKLTHHIENDTAELSHGDVFILPPDIPHYIESGGSSLSFYSMSFMPEYFAGNRESNKLIADFLYYLKTATENKILPRLSLPNEDILFVETVFTRIMSEFSSEKKGKEEVIKECVSVLLSIFARIYFEQKAEALHTEANRDSVMHCIEYIKHHSDEPVTLAEIAKRSTMSKTSFCTIFSSITGMPFKKYLHLCRIERAAELILAGEKIITASSLCGYEYFSTFYRNFKTFMGVSPTEYQKLHEREGKACPNESFNQSAF